MQTNVYVWFYICNKKKKNYKFIKIRITVKNVRTEYYPKITYYLSCWAIGKIRVLQRNTSKIIGLNLKTQTLLTR